jgi:hypothetical protein
MRPLRALGSLASLVLLLAGATAPPSIAPSIVPRIDPEPIRSDIATLAADDFNGRSFRSDEARRAARWIAEKLADAGAKPLVQGADGEPTMLVPIGRMPRRTSSLGSRPQESSRAASTSSSPRTTTICRRSRARSPARTRSTTAPTTTRAASAA